MKNGQLQEAKIRQNKQKKLKRNLVEFLRSSPLKGIDLKINRNKK